MENTLKTPVQALQYLAQRLKTRKDRVALDIVINHINAISGPDHFAKLYLYLFENGLLAYGSTYEAARRIEDVLALDVETLTRKVQAAYNDVLTLKTFEENFVSTEHLNPDGTENIEKMNQADVKKIVFGLPFETVNAKMIELINSAMK